MTVTNIPPSLGHCSVGVGKSLPSLATKISQGSHEGAQAHSRFSLRGLSELKVPNLGELMSSNYKGVGSKYLQRTPRRSLLSSSQGRFENADRRGTWLSVWEGVLG